MTTILSTTLASALMFSPPSASSTVELEIDVSELPSDIVTEDIQRWIREGETEVLVDGGITVTEDAPYTLGVAVRRYGEGDIHYEATVTLTETGQDDPRAKRVVQCEACTETELVGKVTDEVARLSGLILYGNPGPQPEPQPPSETNPPDDSAVQPSDANQPQPRAIGPVGYAGIAIAASGLATAIAGGVYLGRGDRIDGSESALYDKVEHNQKLGGPLLGVGLGVLVVGAVMTGVDVGLRVKRRRSTNNRRVSLDVRPGYAGMSLQARF